MVDCSDSRNALGVAFRGNLRCDAAMRQRQANRYGFEDPEGSSGSLALYAWAGIAAISALTACFTFIIPISKSPVKIVKKPGFAVGQPVEIARRPDIVAPKESPKPVAVAAKRDTAIDDAEVDKLLEKYREKTDEIDSQTTAATAGETQELAVEELRPTQPFPGGDAVGAIIGLSKSIPVLAQRYAALQRRAPDLFEAIDPLVEVVDDGDRMEVRLVAGPFAEQRELADFCRALKLRITVDCSAGDYAGEPLDQ